jgi:hypothetical protein
MEGLIVKNIRKETGRLPLIKDLLLSKGYILGTPEYKKAYNLENWNRRSIESKRNSWRKGYEKKKLKLVTDSDYLNLQRQKDRERKAKQRKLRGDEINEKQRQRYRKNRKDQLRKILENRKRRDPTIGLASLIKDVRAGRRTIRELIDYTQSAVNECSALIGGGKGAKLSGK